jgi:purine-binding chemotaxis protein CheW
MEVRVVTLALAQVLGGKTMASYTRPVVFSVNEQLFGVDIELVQSIEKQLEVVSIPNATEYVDGIINLRGDVIPSYDLRKKFGFPQKSYGKNDETSSIVVSTKDTLLAFVVDAVHQIGDVDSENIVTMPELAKCEEADYLDRVANINGKLVILLDTDKLLTKEEVTRISQVKEKASNEAKE